MQLKNIFRLAFGSAVFCLALGAQTPPPNQNQEPPDEPGRSVARIAVLNGDVSVRRGDSGDNIAANINAPLEASDVIATGGNARTEVEFDYGNRLRLGHDTEARLAEMENGRVHIEVPRGMASFSVLQGASGEAEISTPVVSIKPMEPGSYRIFVAEDGQTTLTVRAGLADVYSPSGSEQVRAGQTMMVRGDAQNAEFQIVAAQSRDAWDNWNEERDASLERSGGEAYKYVSRDIPGAEDLDNSGRWTYDPAYGNVWAPNVGPDWAPYRAGRWVDIDYYGWTWESDDPWGWAPYHYGNWYRASFGWCWYPGGFYERHFWRPALVGFFGYGGGWGNVGWVPLAPFERFHPWYGRGFDGRGGRISNFNVVNNTNITNIYRNARVSGAVSGVTAGAFASGQFHSIGRVNQEQIRSASLATGRIPVTPTSGSYRFNDRSTSVVARSSANPSFPSRGTVAQNNSQWGRFGSPTRPAPVTNYQGNSSAAQSWSRFGNPSARGQQTQNLPVAPSIVHSRSNDVPRTVSRPSYGQSSYSRPSYSAPASRQEPSYSRPAYSQPSYSRPTYSQPSYSRPSYSQPSQSRQSAPSYSRPSYSAPARSSGGGGGGGQHSAPAARSEGGHHGK